jgi:hypothetical protein
MGLELDDASARRFDEDDRSRGDGEPLRERDLSSPFKRFVRNNCSNCNRRSFAHASSNSCDDPPADPEGLFESAMKSTWMWRLAASTTPLKSHRSFKLVSLRGLLFDSKESEALGCGEKSS